MSSVDGNSVLVFCFGSLKLLDVRPEYFFQD